MPYFQINYTDIIFDPKVQTYCISESFTCPNYEKSWSCPPAAPYLKKELSKFRKFYLVYVQFDVAAHVEKVKAKHPKRSPQRIKNKFYSIIYSRRDLDKEIIKFLENYDEEYTEKFILWGGTCKYCMNNGFKKCSYEERLPCRYPDKIQYSMEAVGIDVTTTVNKLNMNIEWPPVNFYYWFGLVCFK